MRHLKHRHQLGRKKEHRIATLANLTAALLTHGRIQTTVAKAKALRPFAEKVITLAKKAEASPEKALHYRRQAVSKVRDRAAVATLFNERASEFTNRPGGFTRIYKLGNRIGDGAEMAVIQLIPGDDTGYEKKKSAKKATKKATKKAAKKATKVEEAPAETEEVLAEEVAEEKTEK